LHAGIKLDVFTGSVDENHDENKRYSEIHTGNAWLPARDKVCNLNDYRDNIPVGLIVFGDKSHTDLHGALALTPIIKRYGSAINFYGGRKTQRCVSKYAVQTANQCYDIMVTKHAMRSIGMEMDWVVVQRENIDIDPSDVVTELDDRSVTFRGQYRLVVTNDILKSMKANDNVYVTWLCSKKNIKRNNHKLCLNKDLVRVLLRKNSNIGDTNCIRDITVTEYTSANINMDNSSKIILYAHPCFQGNLQYDWADGHFQEVSLDSIKVENYYPSHILGFITLQGITEAMIQCAEKPLLWSNVETFFL
jgi:hypothetical protein